METTLAELATTQGLWALLAISLLFDLLKKQNTRDKNQDERETKYQDIIISLAEQLSVVKKIKTKSRK